MERSNEFRWAAMRRSKSSFLLLQPKVAYLVGRDSKNLGIRIFQDIFEKASKLVSDDKTYQNFCNLMEALVAYHKFFGGKD
jgi:CRISPR-associated protein Csm2